MATAGAGTKPPDEPDAPETTTEAQSVLDQTRAPLIRKLEDLRPAYEEYVETEGVLRLLDQNAERFVRDADTDNSNGEAVATAEARQRPAEAPRRRAGRPRGSGGRRDEFLTLIKARPGITIPQAADAMKMQANYLYRVAGDLSKDGLVRKDGQGFIATEAAVEA